MPDYATLDDVRSRVGGRLIDATTVPSTADVSSMLDEAEAELMATLLGAGLDSAQLSNSGSRVVRHWVANYVSGWFRVSYAAAAGDGDNEDGERQLDDWRQRLTDIMKNPAFYAAMLGGGSTPSASIDARSYVTDNADGKTVAGGDFAPVITRDEKW